MGIQQIFQTAQGYDIPQLLPFFLPAQPGFGEDFEQIFPNRLGHKQALRILRQHAQQFVKQLAGRNFVEFRPVDFYLAQVRAVQSGNQGKRRGFSRTVAAKNGSQFTGIGPER